MRTLKKPYRITIYILIIALVLVGGISIYKQNKNKLIDTALYKSYNKELQAKAPTFSSNKDMLGFLSAWLDQKKIPYSVDDAGNLIVTKEASEDKKDVRPTVVITSYDYLTAMQDSKAIATAITVATSTIQSEKYTVIFANNDGNSNKGYESLSRKYFMDGCDVIYLDFGTKGYISTKSFASTNSSISIPFNKEPVKADSMLTLKIGGIATDNISSTISNQPNPITAFGTVLQRMKNKNYNYQISDIRVGSHSSMYPSSIEVDILINSYSLPALTEWLDDKAKNYVKKYDNDFPEVFYEYEVADETKTLPTEAISKEAVDSLNTLLFTVVNGTYRFTKDDAPEGYEADDIYAINCIDNLTDSNGSLTLYISTYAMSSSYMSKVLDENNTAADLIGRKLNINKSIKTWNNSNSTLEKMLQFTYQKVNDLTFIDYIDKEQYDNYFTPCKIIEDKVKGIDIVHMKLSDDRATLYTNTILCYINDKGNLLSL